MCVTYEYGITIFDHDSSDERTNPPHKKVCPLGTPVSEDIKGQQRALRNARPDIMKNMSHGCGYVPSSE